MKPIVGSDQDYRNHLPMYFTPRRPRILAHRGFVFDGDAIAEPVVSENTLAAFHQAMRVGASYIESDVRATKDGVAVLLHDDSFVAADGERYLVDQVTSTELTALKLPCGHHVPTLSDALLAYPELRFNLDLKCDDAVLPAVDEIEKLGASSRVLVTSFSRSRRRKASKLLPNAFSGAGRADALAIVSAALLRQRAALRALARSCHAVQLPSTRTTTRLLSPAVVKRIQDARIEVHIWTPNTQPEIEFWLSRGVDGIITDRVDIGLGAEGEFRD